MKRLKGLGGWTLSGKVWPTVNKFWEVQYSTGFKSDYDMYLRFTTRGDHAGFRFHIQLGRFYFGATVYDHRHWDYETDSFVEYSND